MLIVNVKISRFRNLYDFTIALSSGVNLFWGENGHGKTNLLESIGILLNGTTPRASKLAEVIPHDGESARWGIELDIEDVHHNIECVIQHGSMKKLTIDGQSRKKLAGPDRGVYALTFFPEDFKILTGEPYFRRRFIDETILLTEPKYASILKNYREAYEHRNALLKSGRFEESIIEPFEEMLATYGLEIALRRARATEELDQHLVTLIDDVFNDDVKIRLGYKPSLKEFLSSDDPKISILNAYRTTRSRDIAAKRTIIGPHRDDLISTFGGDDIRQFASRGETRLSVVALVIAKFYMLRSRWEFNPVVLLDDIFSELDQTRRIKVLKALPSNCQLMITAVDRDLSRGWLKDMNDVKTFKVRDGKIEPD